MAGGGQQWCPKWYLVQLQFFFIMSIFESSTFTWGEVASAIGGSIDARWMGVIGSGIGSVSLFDILLSKRALSILSLFVD